ncbi:response regulator [Methylocystis sp. H62]|uniref:response regulator n=1 Tax=Methylocystis sp. H62 TaxID=2785789 RepID=UPI0018C2161D|nr:response regulator [Methylocystis sp. H62]MBG0794253.1 response regulator [Methylocystis sp. H62]
MSEHQNRPIVSVEDSDEDFASLCQALNDAGVTNPVQRCASGRAALDALSSDKGCVATRKAAFVLLDLNMPGADGRGLLELFRSRERSVPVIVLSTSSYPDDIAFCYDKGANGYLVKPLEYDRWQEMIARVATYWLETVALPP